MASNAAGKKGKGKKTLDSNEASKLVAARISQLEVDTAAEKEQEAEIGRFFLFDPEMHVRARMEFGFDMFTNSTYHGLVSKARI